MRKFSILLFTVMALPVFTVMAQNYKPSSDILKARKEFQDMKFGVFIHWGIYSMLADGEWIQWGKRIDRDEYAKLAAGFYPSKFNARQWVKAIKEAGAGYITITSRHHDGFSMFDTRVSDFDIMDATPYKRDILKELSDECALQGIKLHFYYSHMDWHRLDYPLGSTSKELPHPQETTDWHSYFKFMNDQLTELLTRYGDIGAIWFDGMWDHKTGLDWQLNEQYSLIHRLQPSCLIGNNHHGSPIDGEDFQLFEQDLPGENNAGLSSGQAVSSEIPLESCQTMNNTWGYSITDKSYKSGDELIRRIVRSAGMNSNILLNIGPRPDGQIPDEAIERLKTIGEWMKQYGETIKGTRGGIVPPQQWGVSTQKDDKLYLHILDLKEQKLTVPLSRKMIKSIRLYGDATKLKAVHEKDTTTIILPETPDDIDTIIEISLK